MVGLARCTIVMCILGLILIGCNNAVEIPLIPASPDASPEPTCQIVPQLTGEKDIEVVIDDPPPVQAQPGETISFSFSGGYVVYNNAVVCGDQGLVGYRYSDALGLMNYKRSVEVSIDDEMLAEVDCDFECYIEVTVPDDMPAGIHLLHAVTPWRFRELEFELEVLSSP